MNALDAWHGRGRALPVAGNDLFVVDEGPRDERAVVILHGFPGSSFDWEKVVPEIAEHARVIVFDLLGYGFSAKPIAARYSFFEHADTVEKLMAALGVTSAVLVSHDIGDTVCAELLMRATDGTLGFDVERAVLTNGSIFVDMAELSAGQLALLALPDAVLPAALPLDGFRPGLAATFGIQPSDETLDAMIALIERNEGSRLLPRQIRYIEERRANQQRWTDGLVRFAGPMTAAWGELDPIAVPAMLQRLQELRPGTEVLTWPDVGHWPPVEAPERVARVITDRL